MPTTIQLKRNDTHTPITATFRNTDGSLVDLTDCRVNFIMIISRTQQINRSVNYIDAENGRVIFSFAQGESTTIGKFKAEFEVVYPDGTAETFPNSDYLVVQILPDLGDADRTPSNDINGGTFLDFTVTQTYDAGSLTDTSVTNSYDGGVF